MRRRGLPVAVAVASVAVVHLANNIFKAVLLGRFADRRTVLLFGIPGFVASLGGAWLLTYLAGLRPVASYRATAT